MSFDLAGHRRLRKMGSRDCGSQPGPTLRFTPRPSGAAREEATASMTRRTLSWLDGRPHPHDVLAEEPFASALTAYAAQHGIPADKVELEAQGYLDEMLASHRDKVTRPWNTFGRWMLRAHDVVVDEEQIVALRKLDRNYSLAFVFSHRSYLDGFVLPLALEGRRFSPTFTFGGANLDLPVLGALASQTGLIFIRRATGDSPLYRLVLRHYIGYLAHRKANMAWSIEGGRTRTGKLRPPTHGILRYLADAVDSDPQTEVQVVPVSIVYDQLHEVHRMTREARGAAKRPEDFGWLISMARSQRERLGRAYLSFGVPIPLRERLAELRTEGVEERGLVERVAVDASHRINRATPVTVTAVVCLALLGADRALTFDEVLVTVSPLADYITARAWPVAGGATLTDRSTIRRALHELVLSGVLDCYDSGTESVWQVAEGQHLVAAFYRNTVIHILVERAIAEVALVAAAERNAAAAAGLAGPPATEVAWRQALELRDLLKFEFFFPGRRDFEREQIAELGTLAHRQSVQATTDEAAQVLDEAPLYLAHLVLRPFIDAYYVLADRLAAAGDDDLDGYAREQLLNDSLRLGEQWIRQRKIANAESVSLELLRSALKLAEHRGLLSLENGPAPSDAAAAEGAAPAAPTATSVAAQRTDLGARRAAFLEEIAQVGRRLSRVDQLAQRRYNTPANGTSSAAREGARANGVGAGVGPAIGSSVDSPVPTAGSLDTGATIGSTHAAG